MATVKILADFAVYDGSFEGLDAREFKTGAVDDVPNDAAANFILKGLAEDATPKKTKVQDETITDQG